MARATISSQCYDSVASYMDGVNVKIAEAYKPPRKVTLPAAYSNKLPDIGTHTYDFGLEKSVLDKLREWRTARRTNEESRRSRIEERRKRKDSKNGYSDEKYDKEEANDEEEEEEEVVKKKNDRCCAEEVLENDDGTVKNGESGAEVERKSKIVSIKVAPAPKTTILTPQRLSPPVTDIRDNASPRNGGLDYSDFDNDTSSPFDNMELKTINDMEELAQVLQPNSRWIAPPKVENTMNRLTIENHPMTAEVSLLEEERTNDRNNSNSRNVSIIVEELERELARPYMENWKPWPDLESPECDDGETDVGRRSIDSPLRTADAFDLTEEDEKLARHLSDMGFPLSRAARAVRHLGSNDDKRVVEYLLAVRCLEESGIDGDEAEKALVLAEYDQEKAKIYHESLCTLKDLGFSEIDASRALVECQFDRDRALDYLIA